MPGLKRRKRRKSSLLLSFLSRKEERFSLIPFFHLPFLSFPHSSLGFFRNFSEKKHHSSPPTNTRDNSRPSLLPSVIYHETWNVGPQGDPTPAEINRTPDTEVTVSKIGPRHRTRTSNGWTHDSSGCTECSALCGGFLPYSTFRRFPTR